jgi:hypothetical protein
MMCMWWLGGVLVAGCAYPAIPPPRRARCTNAARKNDSIGAPSGTGEAGVPATEYCLSTFPDLLSPGQKISYSGYLKLTILGPAVPGYPEVMDDELTLHELARLEAERKLRSLPAGVLETSWVREAQIEAVIDAVLVVGLRGAGPIALARHTGEWCARIAAALPDGPDPSLARRVGVLSDIEPATLERIAELRHIPIRAKSALLASIAQVAREFATRIEPDERGHVTSPHVVLRAMTAKADAHTRPIVEALQAALHVNAHARVA